MSAAGLSAPAAPPLGTKAPRWGGSAGASTLRSATAGTRSGRGTAAERAGAGSARERGSRGRRGQGPPRPPCGGRRWPGPPPGPSGAPRCGSGAARASRLLPAPGLRLPFSCPRWGVLKRWSTALRRLPGRRGDLPHGGGLPTPGVTRRPGLWPGSTAQTTGPNRCPHGVGKPCRTLKNTRDRQIAAGVILCKRIMPQFPIF